MEGRVGTNTARMTAGQLERLKSSLQDGEGRESSAFMTAGYFENSHGIHFNVRRILVPGEDDYELRTGTRLRMSPEFFSRVLTSAETDGVTVIQSHTHPFSGPGLGYSATDDAGESDSAGTVRDSLGDVPMGSLLFGSGAMVGRVWTTDGRIEPMHQLRVVGRRLSFRPMSRRDEEGDAGPPVDAALYDRQIRAFGEGGQRALSRVRVGVAGAGGTGSAVVEQLARAGVKHITVIDRDKFAKSNTTRMYGTYAATGRRPKAHIAGDNIGRIAPDAEVVSRCVDICSQEALSLLKDCDVVFGCVDMQEPRRALNDLAYRFFIPVIDTGVGIDAEGGRITGGAARVNIVAPSLPCLLCSGAVDRDGGPQSAACEPRGAGARADGQDGLGCDAVPSIVPLTTMAASCAVLLLKDFLLGITESDSCMLVFDLETMSARAMSPEAVRGCACAAVEGMGDCGVPPAAAPTAPAAPDGAGRACDE